MEHGLDALTNLLPLAGYFKVVKRDGILSELIIHPQSMQVCPFGMVAMQLVNGCYAVAMRLLLLSKVAMTAFELWLIGNTTCN